MFIKIKTSNFHLSYCTNIHKGESWNEVFTNIKKYTVNVKKLITRKKWFSIGLCLSNKSVKSLTKKNILKKFQKWLLKKYIYIQTINSFCFTNFHEKNIKQKIYNPNWGTYERYIFTKQIINIIKHTLLITTTGTISTVPLFYKYTIKTKKEKYILLQKSIINLMNILIHLKKINKNISICMEPEPDCYLEKTSDVITFYNKRLYIHGNEYLQKNYKITKKINKQLIKKYIKVCYDICHFSLFKEKIQQTLSKFKKEKIDIGKIQLSSGLKTNEPKNYFLKNNFFKKLNKITKKTPFLHQAYSTIINKNNTISSHYKDLFEIKKRPLLEKKPIKMINKKIWKVHYHIPLYKSKHQNFKTTQKEISNLFRILLNSKKYKIPTSIEIETYTWDNFKKSQKINLLTSIVNEYKYTLFLIKKYAIS